MVRPSNPKLMASVLEAVTHLREGKGSLTRDVLSFVKENSSELPRNLTMQVRRALKHAVNAGLLSCKSGRYKMQLELNSVSRRHRHENVDNYKKSEPSKELSDELPIGCMEMSRKSQDRRKTSRKKRTVTKSRKRSRARGTKRKISRRGTVSGHRARKMTKRPKRRTTAHDDDQSEDWPTRKRKMMSKPKFNDDEDDEEDDDEEEEEIEIEEMRRLPKMKGINEDRFSDVSGDSTAVGRHRSRRSKHLANEGRSPSRRGNGDGKGNRKSSNRSTSRRRRTETRQREKRETPPAEEHTEDQEGIMDEEHDNEVMEMDDNQADVERNGTPPENQRIE